MTALPGNCFADADTSPLDLGDGLTVEVKNELTYGESLRLATRSRGPDGLDLERYWLARLELRLTDWNLPGPDGEPVPLTAETIAGLKPAVAQRINDAIDAFDQAREGGDTSASGAEGNAGGEPSSAASSSSAPSRRTSAGRPN